MFYFYTMLFFLNEFEVPVSGIVINAKPIEFPYNIVLLKQVHLIIPYIPQINPKQFPYNTVFLKPITFKCIITHIYTLPIQ